MSMHRKTITLTEQQNGWVKAQIERNLNTAVNNNMLTVDKEKIPGICKLACDSVDQAFIEKSDLLVNALARHSK